MVTDEQIKRINELSKKKKESGLTKEEEKEQKELYKVFLESFRANFKAQLDNIEIVDLDKDGKPIRKN